MSRARHNRGFTLVELMVVISLLAIMASIAVPNFTQFTRNNQVQAKAEELKTFLVMARTEAVNWRTIIELDLAANDTWQAKRPSQNDQLLRNIEFTQGKVKLVATNESGTGITDLTYRPNGTASNPARFTVCYDEDAENGFLITIQPNGSIRMHPRGKDENNTALAACE